MERRDDPVVEEAPDVTHLAIEESASAIAFEAAVTDLRPGLVRRLTTVVGNRDEAEDLAQEACLRAFRSRNRFDGRDLRAWLHVIGVRLALNELRRRRRALAALVRGNAEQTVPADEPELWECLRALPRLQRAALVLNVLEGYTYAEIASMLDIREGTVGSLISRAKARIRADLSEVTDDKLRG